MGNSIKPEMTAAEAALDESKPTDTVDPLAETAPPASLNRAQRRQVSAPPAPVQADVVPAVLPSEEVVAVVVEPEPAKAPESAVSSAEAVYKMAPGRSTNSARGMLHAGDVVYASDFGGEKRLLELFAAEALVRS